MHANLNNTTMKKTFLSLLLCVLGCISMQAAIVYTRINNKPADGWPNKYLIVYEKSASEAYVWDATDGSNNYVKVSVSNGKISSEDLAGYQVTVTEEKSNRYYVKAADGYIGCDAKKNGLVFSSGGKECTLQSNGGYVILETNTNTCRFLCYETSGSYRFRFYYDADKKWQDSKKHNICFYVLGEVEQEEPQNQLDLQYAHVEMYACESKFPTQNNPYDQYFMTFMFLAQEESDEAVPQIGLEFLAPTQYSIEGTYKSDYTPGMKYFLNCQAGSKHSYFIFPNKSEQGWGQASIKLATMTITKVGPSSFANAYKYHIKLVFTDSNNKIWTLDKDMDVYGWWIDCNRKTDPISNMDPVAFTLESGNHNTQTQSIDDLHSSENNARKILKDGCLYLILPDGTLYDAQGRMMR